MDDDCKMTTFIDEGLIEDCLDDADSIIDLDELDLEGSVIDLDDINNITIVDPGYILEEPLDTYKHRTNTRIQQTEQKRSTYGRESFTLPVTFFDNSRNIRLLTKCRPIVIKIVDCEIYPWYYKKIKRDDNRYSVKIDEERNEEVLCIANEVKEETEEVIEITIPSTPSYVSKINLTPEQSLAVLKLKEDIEKQTCVDIEKKSIENVQEEKLYHPTLTVTEDKNGNNVEKIDLLAYEEIAQSIVRKIDEGEAILKKHDLMNVQEPEFSQRNIEQTRRTTDRKDKKSPSKQREKIITSPILPCKANRQKKTATKARTPKKPSAENHNLNGKRLNSCDHVPSSHRVIPHYHCCRMPMTPTPTANSFYNMDANRISQYYAAKQYLDQNQMINRPAQHQYYHNDNLYGTNNQNFVTNSQHRFATPVQKVVGQPAMYYGPSAPIVCNLQQNQFSNAEYRHISQGNKNKHSIQVPNNSTSKNDYLTTFFNFIGYHTETGRKPDHVRGANVSKENYRVLTQQRPPSYCSSFIVDSIPLNPEFNAAANYSSVRMTDNVHNNPLLTQLLNESSKPSYFAARQNTETKNNPTPSVIQHTSGVLINDNMDKYLLSSESRALNNRLTLHYKHKGGEKIVSLRNIGSTPRSKDECIGKNSSMRAQINNVSGRASESRYIENKKVNLTTVIKEDINDGLNKNTRLDACRLLIRENFAELTKLKNELIDIRKSDTKNNKKPPIVMDEPNTINNSYKEPPKTSGYSPAILPIPTFTKSLEMLSELQNKPKKTNKEKGITDKPVIKSTPEKTNINKESKLSRKRKNSESEMKLVKVKKISLQAYKKRILESLEKDAKASVDKEELNGKTKEVKHNDTLDLGYDSDTTVIIGADN